jgi:hypothetical protein
MPIVVMILIYGGTAYLQYNRTLRWGYRPQRAVLDAVVAAFFFPFAWIAWLVRRPYHK